MGKVVSYNSIKFEIANASLPLFIHTKGESKIIKFGCCILSLFFKKRKLVKILNKAILFIESAVVEK